MSRQKRYDAIAHPGEFVRQAQALVTVIRNLSCTLKYGSPHYTAINALGSHVADTVREVTGREPPWIGNGPIPGLPQYEPRETNDAS
ncbi:MAG: hypothetical protein KJZ83_06875 [Burkholderiaceae bacterium]|nr:hypothetical protein [Burkholderiaceae bacterium]